MKKKLTQPARRAIIAANIRRLRTEAGKTQAFVCSLWGVTQATYSAIEKGEIAPPTFERIWQLAEALGVGLDEFTRIPEVIVS